MNVFEFEIEELKKTAPRLADIIRRAKKTHERLSLVRHKDVGLRHLLRHEIDDDEEEIPNKPDSND